MPEASSFIKTINKPVEEGKKWLQILAIMSACLSSLTEGIAFSWSVPFMPKITKDKDNYDISEGEVVQFQVIAYLTVVICCPIFSTVSDLIGRKRTLLLIAIPDLLTWLLRATGRNVYAFYVASAFVGVSDSIMFAALPSYIGEISTPNVRGTWGNAMTVSFGTGQLLVTVIGSYYSVQVSSYIFMLIPVLFVSTFSFMPESPVFFLMKGRYEEAKNALRKLRGTDEITADFAALKADVNRQMSETGTWRDLFVIESNRKALFAMVFLKVAQSSSGASLFVVYSGYIFEKAGGNLSTETSTVLYMSLHLVLTCFASIFVELLGRRKCLVYSLVPCGIILLIESIYFYVDEKVTYMDISFLNWIPIAGLILFVVCSTFGVDIIPTVMLGEIFSASIKAKGIGFYMMLSAVVYAFFTYLFYVLSSNFGMFAPFIVFACCNVISAILTFHVIPETKGKTLEEIQQNLKKPV